MMVNQGDTLSIRELDSLLYLDERQIYNTRLFNKVVHNIEMIGSDYVFVFIDVDERWYTWPFPIIELADRNFNEWWVQRDRDLSRLNLGVRFYQENMRGRNEQLKAVVQFGFIQKFELFYDVPYINKGQNTGISFGASYSQSKQVAYDVDDNFLLYLDVNQFQRRRFYANFEVNQRVGLYNFHTLTTEFHDKIISDSIANLNPNYFGTDDNELQYFRLQYNYRLDKRDYRAYPVKGWFLNAGFEKLGAGIFDDLDILRSRAKLQKFTPLSKDRKLFMGNSLSGFYTFYGETPFFVEEGLGFNEELVRGYEYYAIYGQQYWLQKNSLAYQIFKWNGPDLNMLPGRKFDRVPLAIYLITHFDHGYISDDKNRGKTRANQYLLGYGLGLDFVSFYDLVFRVEYSRNIDNEDGIYLHFKAAL